MDYKGADDVQDAFSIVSVHDRQMASMFKFAKTDKAPAGKI
jgi:hypothetical protein